MKLNLLMRYTFAIATTCLSVSAVPGQAPGTGAIKGSVLDATGAVIQHAQVTVASDATEARRVGSTDATGTFIFSLLAPGTYTVTAQSAGFSEKTAKAVDVVVSETSVVDFHLTVASVAV